MQIQASYRRHFCPGTFLFQITLCVTSSVLSWRGRGASGWRLPALDPREGAAGLGSLPWTMEMHSSLSLGGTEVPASCCGGTFLQTGGLAGGDVGCRLRDQDTRLCSLQGPALGTERACEARLALRVLGPLVHRPCVSRGKGVCVGTHAHVCVCVCASFLPPQQSCRPTLPSLCSLQSSLISSPHSCLGRPVSEGTRCAARWPPVFARCRLLEPLR